MVKGKLRAVLVASMTIMLCMILMVSGTYALFSSETKVENHLQAGSLKVTLMRTRLVKNKLDENTGYMKPEENNNDVDFSVATTENVFGIGTDELVAPSSSYEAFMKLTNSGSVAFDYKVAIKLTSVSNELAQQMKVYVDGVATGKHLSDYLAQADGSLVTIVTGKMAKGSEKAFSVKIEFENLSNEVNNAAQLQDASFDMVVSAVQRTAE